MTRWLSILSAASTYDEGASRRSHCTASAPAGGAAPASAGSSGTGRQHSALYRGSWSLQPGTQLNTCAAEMCISGVLPNERLGIEGKSLTLRGTVVGMHKLEDWAGLCKLLVPLIRRHCCGQKVNGRTQRHLSTACSCKA